MSEKTVRQLADLVGIPLDRFLEQLEAAGLEAHSADQVIDEEDKMKLLSHLRHRHGKNGADAVSEPKKVILKRKTVTELRQTNNPGRNAKTISVEVRKKRTYVKRSEVVEDDEQLKEKEAAIKALEEQRIEQELADQQLQNRRLQKENAIEAEKEKERKKQDEELQKTLEEKSSIDQNEQNNLNDTKEKINVSTQESKTESKEKAVDASPDNQQQPNGSTVKDVPAVKKEMPQDKPKKGKLVGKRQEGNKERPLRGLKGKTRNKSKRGQPGKPVLTENKHVFEKPTAPLIREVALPEHIVVSDLAQKMSVKAAEVIKHLMKLGIMATINQALDQDTATIVVEEMGHKAIQQGVDDAENEMMATFSDQDFDDLPRAPVVTIMGHVDHGKTSLLDYIRKSKVAEGEAGGITQHIGAYKVTTDHGSVTFLDTPGHAAFTAMRARGAQVTDLVIVVVAADDGVMPQTKEAVQHAKAAGVPIIVAVNKIDKPEADQNRVMQELSNIEVISEEWGGDTQFINVSAKTGQGVDELIEALILQSEILELKARKEGVGSGFVIESRLDKGRGSVATLLVQKGTLEKGDIVVCGEQYGRIRAMFNENGKAIKEAGPSTPVEILGLSGTPNAGEEFLAVPNEKVARELAEHREDKSRTNRMANQQAAKLDEVFSRMESGKTNDLNIIVKTDVQGSLEALRDSLVNLSNDEVKVKIVYGGVGGINEGDVNLAAASNAILIGFNVRASVAVRKIIEEKGLDLHYYSVIYDVIDEVKKSISGLLEPEIKEQITGIAEVRDVFKSPKLGAIAGCMVIDGIVKRNLPIRVLRENIVIYEGQLESLRRFKDDANEVKSGMECGIGVKNYNDVKTGDQIEVFEKIVVQREL